MCSPHDIVGVAEDAKQVIAAFQLLFVACLQEPARLQDDLLIRAPIHSFGLLHCWTLFLRHYRFENIFGFMRAELAAAFRLQAIYPAHSDPDTVFSDPRGFSSLMSGCLALCRQGHVRLHEVKLS